MKEKSVQVTGEKRSGKWKAVFARSEVTVILAVIVLGICFAAMSDGFFTAYNLFNISRTASIYVFIALAQGIVCVVGGMNVSLGSMGGLIVVFIGYAMQEMGVGIFPAILIGLATGVAAGFLNGVIITKLKLNAFVVTLATSFIFAGLVSGISRGYSYTDIADNFDFVGRSGLFGIPMLLIIALITIAFLIYMFRYTTLGRRLLATGGNQEAARMSGINSDRMIVTANVMSGVFTAVAALLWVSKAGSAQPSTGSDWMIISFAVTAIGGTALAGGIFNGLGMLFAAFLLVMVKNGLVAINANVYYEEPYLGLFLLFAVSLESIKAIINARNRKNRLKKQQQEK